MPTFNAPSPSPRRLPDPVTEDNPGLSRRDLPYTFLFIAIIFGLCALVRPLQEWRRMAKESDLKFVAGSVLQAPTFADQHLVSALKKSPDSFNFSAVVAAGRVAEVPFRFHVVHVRCRLEEAASGPYLNVRSGKGSCGHFHFEPRHLCSGSEPQRGRSKAFLLQLFPGRSATRLSCRRQPNCRW